MIRNLKVLFAAAMVLAAFGAMSASGAQGAAALFHCDAEPCKLTLKPDGAVPAKTSHHVFVIKKAGKELGSFTCNELKATLSEIPKSTVAEVTASNLEYKVCTINGSTVEVEVTEGCDYTFTAGETTAGTGKVQVCPSGGNIHLKVGPEPSKPICTVTVEKQPAELSKITYHNIGETATHTTEVTVEPVVTGITATISNDAGCEGLFGAGNKNFTTNEATYTTGNVIVTGATSAGVMSDAWWA